MAAPNQTSENGHWRPCHAGRGAPGVGQVHEMHPYPWRRFVDQEPGLGPSPHGRAALSRAPSTASSSNASAPGGPIGAGVGYRSASASADVGGGGGSDLPPTPAAAAHHHQHHNHQQYGGVPSIPMVDRRSSSYTLAPSAYHDQGTLRTVREDDEDESDMGDNGGGGDSRDGDRGRRRFCCCCWGGGGDGAPLWARRLWAWVVFNRCLVYGIVAAILCIIVFGVVFGAVLPKLSSQSSPSPAPSFSAFDEVPPQCTLPQCSSSPYTTPEPSSTSSATSTSSTSSSSSRPAPTNLPDECDPKGYIKGASFLAVHGDPNYLFAFSPSRSPEECCAYCYRRVSTGCHGWRFTPGSSTTCTYIHSYNGNGPKDKTCPYGSEVPIDIASDQDGSGPNQRNVGGVGPCGVL